MSLRGLPASLALVAVLLTAGCGQDTSGYGAASAGPTLEPEPSSVPAGPPAGTQSSTSEATPSPSAERTGSAAKQSRAPCDLFTDEAMSVRLGLDVRRGVAGSAWHGESCTWKVRKPQPLPDWLTGDPVLQHAQGVITVARTPADRASAMREAILAGAKATKADTMAELPSLGTGAFAVGGSVSGVPIWRAMAVRRDTAVGVQFSGYGTSAGEASVKELLADVLTRL